MAGCLLFFLYSQIVLSGKIDHFPNKFLHFAVHFPKNVIGFYTYYTLVIAG